MTSLTRLSMSWGCVALPPLQVGSYRCTVPFAFITQATLLDGAHRRRVSVALGFVEIPCIQPSREGAVFFGYNGPSDAA
jgi:hypothetical protein